MKAAHASRRGKAPDADKRRPVSAPGGDDPLSVITLRLTGTEDSNVQLEDTIRGMHGVERVEEMGVLAPHVDDDSSSSGSAETRRASSTQLEIGVVDPAVAEVVYGRAEIAARNAGVVIEWIDRF